MGVIPEIREVYDMVTNVKYWLWLTDLLEPADAWQVFCHFGSPEQAYFADPEEYERRGAGKDAVIVGDPEQMAPTRFFAGSP